MKLPDINVLVYAFRRDSTQHAVARSWLERTVDEPGRFGVSKLALAGVARILSNPRGPASPTPISEAFAFCDGLLAQPNCDVVEPGERHWVIFRDLCIATDTRGVPGDRMGLRVGNLRSRLPEISRPEVYDPSGLKTSAARSIAKSNLSTVRKGDATAEADRVPVRRSRAPDLSGHPRPFSRRREGIDLSVCGSKRVGLAARWGVALSVVGEGERRSAPRRSLDRGRKSHATARLRSRGRP